MKEPLSQKQIKEMLTIVLAVLILVLAGDYVFTSKIVEQKGLYNFFYKGGEIFRLLYFLIFGTACFYNAKLRIAETENKYALENNRKIIYAIISVVSIGAIVLINALSPLFISILYPVLFLAGNIFTALLILSYVEPEGMPDASTDKLGVEKEPSKKATSIVLPVQDGFLNIENPFRSVLIVGGAGAGKSASIIEPIIFDATQKGFPILLYDFKFPTLGNILYSCYSYHKIKPDKMKFYSISFTDVTRSHRFNPLDPRLLFTSTYAEEYSWTLYSNLDKDGAKKGGFFPESASSLLKAVIWFMKLEHPEYCTVPHVMNLILNAKTEVLVKMLGSNIETKGMCKPVAEAAGKKEAGAQLAGVVGSLTMQLQKINTPEANWVLSGDDFTLDLNSPHNPKSLVLGNSPQVQQALSPILAFISNVALKTMNDQGKIPSLAIFDEAPTLVIPNIEVIPNTARSNKLGLVYSIQDISQMDKYQGPETRKAIIGSLATQFFGQINSTETAELACKLFGKEYKQVKSTNRGSSSSDGGDSASKGYSFSEQQRDVATPQDFMEMPTGTFMIKTVEATKDWFKAKFKRIKDANQNFTEKEIPSFVDDFKLTEEDMTIIDRDYAKYLKNPASIFESKNKNITDIIYKHGYNNQKEISITQDFLNDFKQTLESNYKQEKNLKILSDNFKKINDEVEDIIILYTDVSSEFDKIVNANIPTSANTTN